MLTDAEELPVGQLLEINAKFHIVIDGQPDIIFSEQPQLDFDQIQITKKGTIQVGSFVYILDGQIFAVKEGALVNGYYQENYHDGRLVREQGEDDVLRVASESAYENAEIFRDQRKFDSFGFHEENGGSSSSTGDDNQVFTIPDRSLADHTRDKFFAEKAQELLGLLSDIDMNQLDHIHILATEETRQANFLDFYNVLYARSLERLQQINILVGNVSDRSNVICEFSINRESSPKKDTPRVRTRHKLKKLKEEGTPITWEEKAEQLKLPENEIANLKKVKELFEKMDQFSELILECQKGPVGADDLIPFLQKQFQKTLVTDDHIDKVNGIVAKLQHKKAHGKETYLAVTFYAVLYTLKNVDTKAYLQRTEENLINEFVAKFTEFKETLAQRTKENTQCKNLLQNLSFLCGTASTLDELEQLFSSQIKSNLPENFQGARQPKPIDFPTR